MKVTEVFVAVADEIAELFGGPSVGLFRCEPDRTVTTMATSADGSRFFGRTGRPPTARVFRTGRPARMDGYGDASGPIASALPGGTLPVAGR